MTSAEPRATFSEQRWTAGPLTRQRRLLIRMTMSSANQCRSYMAHLRCQLAGLAVAAKIAAISSPNTADLSAHERSAIRFVLATQPELRDVGLIPVGSLQLTRVCAQTGLAGVLAKQAMMPIGRRIGDLKRYLLSGAPPPTGVWFSATPARPSPETPVTPDRSESFEFENL